MTTPEVTIAPEDPAARESAALMAELAALLDGLYPEDAEDPPAPWTVDDLARERTFLVARVAGEAAGCAALVPLAAADALEIVRMYVRPDYRGRRIAERLLAGLQDLARGRGARALRLRCGPRQPDALALYERNGFTRRTAFAQHREHPTNLFYEKRL